MSCDREERGQTAAEYLGLLVLVAVIVLAIARTDLSGTIACGVQGAVARIAQSDAPGCKAETTPSQTASPTPAPSAAPTEVPVQNALPTPTAYPQEPPNPQQSPEDPDAPKPGEPTQEIPDGWTPNGCGSAGGTNVPDAPLGFDFKGACNAHDTCYKEQRGRSYCDGRLRGDLYEVCLDEPFLARSTCMWAANTYADFVWALGGDAYEAAEND